MSMTPAQLRVEMQGKVSTTISAGQIPVLEVEEEAWIETTEPEELAPAAQQQGARGPASRAPSLRDESGDAVRDQPVEQLGNRFLGKRRFGAQRGLAGISSLRKPSAGDAEGTRARRSESRDALDREIGIGKKEPVPAGTVGTQIAGASEAEISRAGNDLICTMLAGYMCRPVRRGIVDNNAFCCGRNRASRSKEVGKLLS